MRFSRRSLLAGLGSSLLVPVQALAGPLGWPGRPAMPAFSRGQRWWPAGSVLAVDFRNSRAQVSNGSTSLASLVDITRASSGWAEDSNSVWSEFASGALRITDKGVLIEQSATNSALHARDWTQAAYSATNITAAKDQTGIDGVANSASSLTADANNGTIFQSITLASAERTASVFVKRITGSGTVEFTDDGGSTYVDITSSLSTGSWFRNAKTRTQANPSLGFRLGTSGDAIAVDFLGIESGDFASSPITTAGSAATRAADNVTLSSSALTVISGTAGSIDVQGVVVDADALENRTLFYIGDGTADERLLCFISSGNEYVRALGVDGGVTQFSFLAGTSPINPVADGQTIRVCLSYEENNIDCSGNGGTVQTDSSATVPDLTLFQVGFNPLGGNPEYWKGYIHDLVYFDAIKEGAANQARSTVVP